MSKTVVGLFSTAAQAEKAKDTLVADGFSASAIKIVGNNPEGHAEEGGIGQKISHFFSSLTGGEDKETNDYYTQGVTHGGALLSVDAEADEADEVAATLKQYGAQDLNAGYGSETSLATPAYGQTATGSALGATGSALGTTGSALGTTGSGLGTTAGATGEVIPVVAEELVVGKREVDRGGVRVFSRVVEQPVSADVTLRDEYVNVERRVVDRPATAADFSTAPATIELRATGEEAVVGKSSRVVEEIVVGKETTAHTEAVHDTVRHTEVEVEDLAGTTTTTNANRY